MEKIELQGIERLHDGINTDSGTCDEILNLRKKDGQWILMNPKEEGYDLTGLHDVDSLDAVDPEILSLWYRHSVSDSGKFIAYYTVGSINDIIEVTSSGPTSKILLSLSSGEVCSKIYHFGNILIVNTDIDVYYLMIDTLTGVYELLPDLRHGEYSLENLSYNDINIELLWKPDHLDVPAGRHIVSDLINAANDQHKNGRFTGHTFVIGVIALADGSYIKPTSPMYIHNGIRDFDETDINAEYGYMPTITEDVDGPDLLDNWNVSAHWEHFSTLDVLSTFDNQILDDYRKYKGFVKGIAFFTTKPLSDRIQNMRADKSGFEADTIILTNITDVFFLKTPNYDNSLKDKLSSSASYYLGKLASLEELSASPTYIQLYSEGINDIETKESLNIDDFTHHKLIGDVMYEYNSRLHIANITNKLGDGTKHIKYDISLATKTRFPYIFYGNLFIDEGTTSPVSFDIYKVVKLNEDGVEYVILSEEKNISFYSHPDFSGKFFIIMEPVLSYPDSRATSIQYLGYSGGSFYALTDEIILTSHTYRNLAYSVVDYIAYTNTINTSCSLRVYAYRVIELALGTQVATPIDSRYLKDINRVQVSKVNNPLFFPAKNSYRIGRVTNTVTGVMSQAVPMSEGQYGYFPLVIFSNEGIFSLEQGTGDILYQSVQPVSLDVLTNPNSVMAVDGGIMFVSEKGIIVLSGRKTIEVSEVIEGLPKSDIKSDTNYLTAIDGTDNVVTLDDSISTVDFKEFLEDAIMAYDQVRDEIIVSSTKTLAGVKAYGYSYIFGVKDKSWYKTSQTFSHFIMNYPGWYFIEGSKIYIMDEVVGKVSWLIKTNPFKLGLNNIKTIERIVTRMSGEFAHSSGYFISFYLYGSLNGIEWKLISGIRPDHTDNEMLNLSLMLRKVRTSAKYFIIFMASSANSIVLNGWESDVKVKVTKKVR